MEFVDQFRVCRLCLPLVVDRLWFLKQYCNQFTVLIIHICREREESKGRKKERERERERNYLSDNYMLEKQKTL